jgi:hypothetical protein
MKKMGELLHNKSNAVTASIARVEVADQILVRKVLNGRNEADADPQWRASHLQEHWNYWPREADVYRSELPRLLSGTGVRLPRLHSIEAPDDQTLVLLLEDVGGRSGHALSVDDYVLICGAWGRAQAQLERHPGVLEAPWASTGFVRGYTMSKIVEYQLLESDVVWQQPLIADNWPAGLRAKLVYLYQHWQDLYAILERGPQLPSHLDFWPNNVFVTEQGEVVPVDWAFFGSGAIAEDVGNFIPDAVFDGFVGSAELPDMTDRLLRAYSEGLTEGGFVHDRRELQMMLWASAVKYVWLGPLLLARASSDQQRAYGGAQLADPNEQYRHRGAALDFLGDWAIQAMTR